MWVGFPFAPSGARATRFTAVPRQFGVLFLATSNAETCREQAASFPKSKITAVSSSKTQKARGH